MTFALLFVVFCGLVVLAQTTPAIKERADRIETSKPLAVKSDPHWANHESWGAKCDGSTDDKAAIQAALDDAATNCGVVVLPRGTCMIQSKINIPTCVTLTGLGDDVTTLKAKAAWVGGTNGMVETASGAQHNFNVRDLHINADSLVNNAIRFTDDDTVRITNVRISNTVLAGIHLAGTSGSTAFIDRVQATNTITGSPASQTGSLVIEWDNCVVQNSYFTATNSALYDDSGYEAALYIASSAQNNTIGSSLFGGSEIAVFIAGNYNVFNNLTLFSFAGEGIVFDTGGWNNLSNVTAYGGARAADDTYDFVVFEDPALGNQLFGVVAFLDASGSRYRYYINSQVTSSTGGKFNYLVMNKPNQDNVGLGLDVWASGYMNVADTARIRVSGWTGTGRYTVFVNGEDGLALGREVDETIPIRFDSATQPGTFTYDGVNNRFTFGKELYIDSGFTCNDTSTFTDTATFQATNSINLGDGTNLNYRILFDGTATPDGYIRYWTNYDAFEANKPWHREIYAAGAATQTLNQTHWGSHPPNSGMLQADELTKTVDFTQLYTFTREAYAYEIRAGVGTETAVVNKRFALRGVSGAGGATEVDHIVVDTSNALLIGNDGNAVGITTMLGQFNAFSGTFFMSGICSVVSTDYCNTNADCETACSTTAQVCDTADDCPGAETCTRSQTCGSYGNQPYQWKHEGSAANTVFRVNDRANSKDTFRLTTNASDDTFLEWWDHGGTPAQDFTLGRTAANVLGLTGAGFSVWNSATPPVTCGGGSYTGVVYWDTTSGEFCVCNGTNWINQNGGATCG